MNKLWFFENGSFRHVIRAKCENDAFDYLRTYFIQELKYNSKATEEILVGGDMTELTGDRGSEGVLA